MKDTSFSLDELLLMAQQIERNGARFYRRAAGGFPKGTAKDLLLELARFEDDHEQTFASMRENQGQTGTYDPDQLATLYLNALADGQIFDPREDPSEKLTGRETLEEVLQLAVGIEKDSIVFYVGLKEAVPESLGKTQVDKIIQEEMSHLFYLNRELASLNSDLL